MNDRFVSFLLVARWASAIVALMYHARFLLFVGYDEVEAKTGLSKAFYFLTGLGHESFAVFFVVDGLLAGLLLLRHRSMAVFDGAALSRHMGSLYRILLPGLVLGASFDLAGLRFFNGSGLYTAFPEFSTPTLSYSSLLGNLFMLQPFVVPTFGSNSMLYLLSYLFWSFILLFVLVRATELDKARGRLVQALLLALVVLVMPPQFLVWAATWLAGAAVVVLGASRLPKPPLLLAVALFIGALVLSRLAGANTGLLPPPFGAWLVQCRHLLVGLSFAAIAWSLYPAPAWGRPASLLLPALGVADGRAGQAASFTFFCHFPVIMLLVGTSSALFDQPIMQQPTPARYLEFAVLVIACVAMTAIVTRLAAAVVEAMTARR